MSFSNDLRRTMAVTRWATYRSAAVQRLTNLRTLATVSWPTYRDTVAESVQDKAEVDAVISLIPVIASALIAKPGTDAGEQEITDLLTKFDPDKRERKPRHAVFLIDAQQQSATAAKAVREVRGDLNALSATIAADKSGDFSSADVADIDAAIMALNDALAAIAGDDAAGFAAAVDQLKVS